MTRALVRAGLVGIVAVTAIGVSAAAPSDAMKAVVSAYLDMQTQLAADKTAMVKAQARAIGAQANAMGDAGTAIAGAAANVEKVGDIKAARDAFGSLSDAVIAAAKKDGWTDGSSLKLAYCPMVKRSWLQSEDKLQNPYLGKTMSGCGEVRKMQ